MSKMNLFKAVVPSSVVGTPADVPSFGATELGPVYQGVIVTRTAEGKWQLAFARVQGSEAQLDLLPEQETGLRYAWDRMESEIEKMFQAWGRG